LVTKDSNQFKITSDIRKVRERKKVRKEVAERLKMPKFGMCTGQPRGMVEAGVNIVSKDEVKITNRERDVEQDIGSRLLDSINSRKGNVLKEMKEAKEREKQEKLAKLFQQNKTQTQVVRRIFKRENSIKVSGFNPNYVETDLAKIFGECGEIKKIYIPRDKFTGALRNFAFIDFTQSQGMKDAISKMNESAYDGCVLKVEPAEQK
jgi:RNA recognition motif-containing protein